MRARYLDLETGLNLTITELLEFEQRKDVVWEAADEMRSLLEDLAKTREEEGQQLLVEAKLIQDYLKKYDAAVEKLHGSEGGHQAPERLSVAYARMSALGALGFYLRFYRLPRSTG
jgi:acyl-CoA reductase-like NAD-dependent aldehyde dehydrogenase